MVNMNRQLLEIMSWRALTEIVRRHPARLRIAEAHPAGGFYDSLELFDAPPGGQSRHLLTLNRPGSAHICAGIQHRQAQSDHWTTFYQDYLEAEEPLQIIDRLTDLLGLPPVSPLPASTPLTLVYRLIAALLTHAALGRVAWQCRSGYQDGPYGSGIAEHWFGVIPAAAERLYERRQDDLFGEPARRFWFLLRAGEPVICLETTGLAWDRHGQAHQLMARYARDRRIWPLVVAVAGDLLP
ncbi:MAG: hypothetical protein IT340_11115 [Chloroflexi bacterium]|nr:hypothetical protein [Chloroflexota bacterium]